MTMPASLRSFIEAEGLDPRLLEPDALPTPLALPWLELWTEQHPRVQLHWLTDILEMMVRWCTAVALAEARQAHGELPADLLRMLADHIERPTLGRWMHMFRVLAGRVDSSACLVPGIFELSAALDAACPRDGDTETSLVALRNHVAHAGGMRNALAEALLRQHLPALSRLLEATARACGEVRVVARAQGITLLLQGPTPRQTDEALAGMDAPEGAWIVGGGRALALSPILLFGPVRRVTADGHLRELAGEAAPQLYTRMERDRLSYTPIGRDEPDANSLDLEPFRALFGLGAGKARSEKSRARPALDQFLREAEGLSAELIGRTDEVARIESRLQGQRPWMGEQRIGWISAGPGYGKSMLMARAATDWAALCQKEPRKRGLYLHRFRGGDARNNRRAFLRGLMGALTAWAGLRVKEKPEGWERHDEDELADDVRALLEAMAGCAPSSPPIPRGKLAGAKKSRVPLFVIMADGLDEIASQDRGFAALLCELAGPGVSLLLAGRPEFGLDHTFSGEGCEALFAGGLGPMSDADIHSMLLAGLGNARYALLARDEEDAGGVHNAFVERVVSRAKGLPLYVHLLLEDLRAGNLTVHDEDRLPDGLNAYYDDLVQRMGLSTVQRDLPLLIAALAVAEEPLDGAALAQLLAAPYMQDEAVFAPRVEAALRVGTGLLRAVPTPEGTAGHSLYHQSFREYVTGRRATDELPEVPACAVLAETVDEARRRLYRTAAHWRELPDGNLRRHLFRWGAEYALWWQQPTGAGVVAGRMTDFAYLQARGRHLSGEETNDLIREYPEVEAALPAGTQREEFGEWSQFFRERAHLLRRGGEPWGVDRLLRQLAAEHADDSPVTRAAEAWMEEAGEAPALVAGPRPASLARGNLRLVLEGHGETIDKVLLDGPRLISLASGEVKVWDASSGECLISLEGSQYETHLAGPGRLLLGAGRSGKWSTFELWDLESLRSLGTFNVIGDGTDLDRPDCIVTSGEKGEVRLVSTSDGTTIREARFGKRPCKGVKKLGPDRALAWALGGVFWLWDPTSREIVAEVPGPRGLIHVIHPMDDSSALLRKGKEVMVLNTEAGTLTGPAVRCGDVAKSMVLGGRLFVFLNGGKVERWSTAPLERQEEFDIEVNSWDGLSEHGEVLLARGNHGILALHRDTGDVIINRRWAPGSVRDVHLLGDGTFLVVLETGERGFRSCHFVLSTGEELHAFEEEQHPVAFVLGTQKGMVISRASGALYAWRPTEPAFCQEMKGHKLAVRAALTLPGNRIISRSKDPDLNLWDLSNGQRLATLEGHQGSVRGWRLLEEAGRLLTWGDDQAVITWDLESATMVSRTTGPGCDVADVHALDSGLLLSTSEGTLRLWNPDGSPRAVLEGHTEPVEGWIETDSGHLATWASKWQGEDRAVRVWNTRASLDDNGPVTGHTGTVTGMLALDHECLLTWSSDRSLRLWNRQDGSHHALLAKHPGNIDGAMMLKSGKLLTWTETRPSRMYLWDVEREPAIGAEREPMNMLTGHAGDIRFVELLDCGHVISRGPRCFIVMDAETGQERSRFPTKGRVKDFWWWENDCLLVQHDNGEHTRLSIWDPTTNTVIWSLDVLDEAEVCIDECRNVFLYSKARERISMCRPGIPDILWTREVGHSVRYTSMRGLYEGAFIDGRVHTSSTDEDADLYQVWTIAGEKVLDRVVCWADRDREECDFGTAGNFLLSRRHRRKTVLARDACTGEVLARLAYDGTQSFAQEPYSLLADDIIFCRNYRYGDGGGLIWNLRTGLAKTLHTSDYLRKWMLQLADKTCISTTGMGELVHWCPAQGDIIHRGTPRQLLCTAPDIVEIWLKDTAPHQVENGRVAVVDAEGIVVRDPDGTISQWHASGDWTLHAMEDDGRMIVFGGTSVQVIRPANRAQI